MKNRSISKASRLLGVAVGLAFGGLNSSAWGACGTASYWASTNCGVGVSPSYWDTTAASGGPNWDDGSGNCPGTVPIPGNPTSPNLGVGNSAVIVADTFPPYYRSAWSISCLTIQSGSLNLGGTSTLTITGDYFRNLNLNSLKASSGSIIKMAGTAAQTFENVDPVSKLVIATGSTVELTQSFTVSSAFTINTGSGLILIDKTVTLTNTATPLTIPTSATVEVKSGGILVALGGIKVNGVLKIDAGGKVQIGNGVTLSVPIGGVLQMAGSPGNVATLDADQGASRYNLSIAGSINANYFTISRTTAAGLNITGSAQTISNGDFHYLTGGGYAVTLGSAASVPATWSTIGFYDDANTGTAKNINASTYTGAGFTVTNWSGLGGAANANDPGAKITWGPQAGVSLQMTNATASGKPPSTIAKNSISLFATFGFSLTQTATATNITSVKITLSGSLSASDINYIQVFGDANNNCVYDAGVDTQIGGNLTVTGSPPTATVTIPAGVLSPSGTAQRCIHVLVATSSTAQTGVTLAASITGSADVVNSQNYPFSLTGGPPVTAGSSKITGASPYIWTGANTNDWWLVGSAGNWNQGTTWANAIPTTATDCQVGAGSFNPILISTDTPNCLNASFPVSGTLDWGATNLAFRVNGSLTVDPSYSFLNAASGSFLIGGSTNQSINFGPAWPGSVTVNSTGGIVSVNNNWTINGALTLTSGTLSVSSGMVLTVLGNVTINGGSLVLQPGATLKLGPNAVVTVGAAGTLSVVGSSTQNALVTSTGATNSYTVVVNGAIQAQYYTFDHLGLGGVTINSGATINATNFLQNGTFSYPVANGAVLLTLNRLVPGNALSSMTFDSGGSAATGVLGLKTNANGAGASLTISQYSGNLTGAAVTTVVGTAPSNYPVIWAAPVTTLKLTQNAVGPASVNQGQTYTMGMFGFQQTDLGAFANTDLTTIKLTMTGTATASDVTAARLYYDAGCTGATTTLLGSATFAGAPATAIFSGLTGATVQSSVTAPPVRCIVVQYDISSSATSGATVGAQIASAGDVVNSQSYAFNGTAAPPVNLGSPASIIGMTTTWIGGTTGKLTDWFTASNWNGGLPTPSLNCVINSATNNPVIGAGTASCKSLTIGNGNLTMTAGSGAVLEIYGGFTNTGTFTQNGQTLTIRDNGTVATNQTIQSSSTLDGISFNKTAAGGSVLFSSGTLTIGNAAATPNNSFTIPAGNSFTFDVQNGGTLVLRNGATLTSGVFQTDGGAAVQVGNGKAITINGGTFKANGVNDSYPQATTNKALFTVSGAGTWTFTATSGAVDLTGFLFDWLDLNGLNIGGTTTLANLNGGQLRNLSTNYAAVKPLQLNTTGTIPSLSSNFGWNWGPTNAPPAATAAYAIASSTGCGNQSINFDQWFGDFYSPPNPNPQTKVSATGCTITVSAAASPVNLLSFTASPYNGSVVLNWSTGLEVLHQGFNVYRSVSPDGGYAQLNSTLIRNLAISQTAHGIYQFFDTSVINGTTYYYMIEDLATNGTRTMHGPVSAFPASSSAAAPAPGSGAIIGSGPSGTTPPASAPSPTPFAPGQETLAPGVTVLAKTQHSMRIQIDVPAYTTTPDSVSPEVHLDAPGYSHSIAEGKPELLERMIMVEIPPSQTANLSVVSTAQGAATPIHIAPAPHWAQSGNTLVASRVVDAVAYGTNQFSPASPVSLGAIAQSQGRYYLPVTIQPMAFNPVAASGIYATQIIFDVFLDGSPAWNVGGVPSTNAGPWGLEGALQIRVDNSGVYQLSFADFVAAGVDGPFRGADVTKLRLFKKSTELPLEITSATGFFGGTDTLKFYTPHSETFEDSSDTLLLYVDTVPGLRISSLSGAIGAQPASTEVGYAATAKAEQNLMPYFNSAYGENRDHVLWGTFCGPVAPGCGTPLSTVVNLPNLIPNGTVMIRALVKGSFGSSNVSPVHHLQIFVNNSRTASAEAVFSSSDPYPVTISLPASLFQPGQNRITFAAVGDLSAPDWDIISLDRYYVDYLHGWRADSDVATAITQQAGSVLSVSGFSGSDIVVYDTSDPSSIAKVSGTVIGPDGSGGQGVSFASASGDPVHGSFFWVGRSSLLPKPTSLTLNPGSRLHDALPGADVIYIGPAALLDAVKPLADLRASQGFRVQLVDIESVFSEFGQGVRSGASLKAFLQYAASQWQKPAPQYVVLVGDGTYDPKGALGFPVSGTVPVHLLPGAYVDYASDNWFVAWNGTDNLPDLAIGRIPGNTPALITTYVNKVLAYESGAARPQGSSAGKIVVVADNDQIGGERFATRAQQLAAEIQSVNPSLTAAQVLRPQLTDAQLKQSIIQSFNSGPTLIHYLGHGAEDRWAGAGVFLNADADALQNARLPIVIAMNCLNAYFYDANPAFQSLADRLLFNPHGGAIAFWGSTSATNTDLQSPYQNALYDVLGKNPGIRLGDAVRLALVQGGWAASRAEVIGSWTLLGDPMLKVSLPAPPAAPSKSQPDPSAPSSSSSSGSGHGFLSCATIESQGKGNGKGGGPGGSASAEASLLLAALIFTRRVLRRAPQPAF